MRFLWTLAKVVLGLAIAIPVIIIALTTVLGIFGAVVGLAVLVLRIAVVGFIVWGLVKLAMGLFGGGGERKSKPVEPKYLAPVDPHYEAAMRELDRELGDRSR